MSFVDPTGQTVFDLIGPNSGVDVKERIEQEVEAGTQFDGTADKGRFDWSDSRGRVFERLIAKVGVESKTFTLEMVDKMGRRFLIDKRIASTETDIIITGNLLLAPDEHLELVTTGATAAMYANIVLKR